MSYFRISLSCSLK